MAISKREKRVVDAFINCIRMGEYTEDYAITLIEDESRYGWMSSEAKDYFYEELDKLNPPEPEPAPEPEPEPEETEGEAE